MIIKLVHVGRAPEVLDVVDQPENVVPKVVQLALHSIHTGHHFGEGVYALAYQRSTPPIYTHLVDVHHN